MLPEFGNRSGQAGGAMTKVLIWQSRRRRYSLRPVTLRPHLSMSLPFQNPTQFFELARGLISHTKKRFVKPTYIFHYPQNSPPVLNADLPLGEMIINLEQNSLTPRPAHSVEDMAPPPQAGEVGRGNLPTPALPTCGEGAMSGIQVSHQLIRLPRAPRG